MTKPVSVRHRPQGCVLWVEDQQAGYGTPMIKLQRTVQVQKPVGRVFTYLSDFTTTTEWDPGTVRTVLVKGDGGVGTEYHNTSKFAGRETELTYVLTELSTDKHIKLRGENKSVISYDTLDMRSTGGGTEVVYTVEFEFRGVGKYLAPLLRLPLKKLADDGKAGLEKALAGL